MAMIERRSRVAYAPWSKRSLRGASLATRVRMLCLAVAAAMACAFASGCDGSYDDLDARAHAADDTPMLPGTRAVAALAANAGAQRFDTADGTPPRAASDALLPPVMHTAD